MSRPKTARTYSLAVVPGDGRVRFFPLHDDSEYGCDAIPELA